ncbi:MAG: conjugal transfer protein TraF [Pseudomonadota bacterium]
MSGALAAPLPSHARSPLGVTLFGAGWCHFCHSAAQLLVSLQNAGQVELLVISIDHRPIGVVTDPVPDDGHAAALGVHGVPVTVVFDPATGEPSHFIRGFRGYGPFLKELRAAAAAISS